jgi:hypothetical protein
VNPFLPLAVVLLAEVCVVFFVLIVSSFAMLVVAVLTTVPARMHARRPVAEILQSELA